MNTQNPVLLPFKYLNNSNNNINNNNSSNINSSTTTKCMDCNSDKYSCYESCSFDNYYNEYECCDYDDEQEEELFRMFGNGGEKEIYSCPYLNCLNEGYNQEELASHLLECHQEQLLKSIYIVCPLCTNENNNRHNGNFIDHIKDYHMITNQK